MEDPRPPAPPQRPPRRPTARAALADPELRAALRAADEVLFLCSGNILRSAFAELYARHLGCALPVRSAGTRYENDALHPATARALRECGVACGSVAAFRPTYLPRGRAAGARTLVLGMTREHLAGQPAGRSFLAAALLGEPGEIEDPIGYADPAPVLARVARCVECLVHLARGG